MKLPHRLFPCSVKHDVTDYIIWKTEDCIFHQKPQNKQLLCILQLPLNFTPAFNELADGKARHLSKICAVIVRSILCVHHYPGFETGARVSTLHCKTVLSLL